MLVDDGLVATRQGVGAFVLRTDRQPRAVDVLAELRRARSAIDRAIGALGAEVSPATTTLTCGACGIEHTGMEWDSVTAWADAHTDTQHPDEARWPNTFTVRYARRPADSPPGVYYRWPGGQRPAGGGAWTSGPAAE